MLTKLFVLILVGGLSLPTSATMVGANMKGVLMHSCSGEKCLRLKGEAADKSAFGDIWVFRNVTVEIVKADTKKLEREFPGMAFVDEFNHRVVVMGKSKSGRKIETVIDLNDLNVKTYAN